MRKKELNDTKIESLMDMLGSKDGMIRKKARESLVVRGKPAVTALNKALRISTSEQVRWEAAKALGEIGDVSSIPTLVKALEDSSADVAWLAAEALGKFKKTAWPPLLRALIKADKKDSFSLRKGAHHIIVNQNEAGFNDLLTKLIEGLESGSMPESAIEASSEILKRIREKQ